MVDAVAPTPRLISENPLFSTYVFHSGILCSKLLVMSFLTARLRIQTKGCISDVDTKMLTNTTVDFTNPDVERVRRAHRNDLQNIPIFLFISCLYVLTSPQKSTAINLFRTFTTARIIHTLVSVVYPMPHLASFLAWVVGFGVTAHMLVMVIKHYF